MTTKNNRIQILRGIAIIAVVCIHTCNGGMWQVVCRPFLNFAVAMFFFLSGYLTDIDNDNWPSFFKRRTKRVIIPYIIWTVLYTFPHLTPGNLLYNLLTTRASGTLYYIFVYIQFIFLTPLIGRMAKGKHQWIGWIITPVSVLIFKYSRFIWNPSSNYTSLIWDISCLGWFIYYYLGLLLGNHLIHKSFNLSRLLIYFLISIPVQMLEGYGWLLAGDSNCGTQLKLSADLTSSLFLLISYCYLNYSKLHTPAHAQVTILSRFGDYSFGIYLVHIMIMRALYHIPLYAVIPFPINSVIVLFLSAGLVYMGRKCLSDNINKWIGFI